MLLAGAVAAAEKVAGWTDKLMEERHRAFGMLVEWFGTALASVWLWSQVVRAVAHKPYQPPITWYAHRLTAFGGDSSWLLRCVSWSHLHANTHWALLVGAMALGAFSVGDYKRHALRSGAFLRFLATLALLVAVEQTSLKFAFFNYLWISLVPPLIALVLDFVGDQSQDERWLCIPGIVFNRWLIGPASPLWFPVFGPVVFASVIIDRFRVEADTPPRSQPSGALPTKAFTAPPLPRAGEYRPSASRNVDLSSWGE